MSAAEILWPDQNDVDVVRKIREILKAEFQLEPMLAKDIDIRKSDCSHFKQCNSKVSQKEQSKCKLTLPQKVVRALMRPEIGYNLMLRHDVGTGKTCAALGAASNYAADGRFVWWVTRYNLISSVKKNLAEYPPCCFPDQSVRGNLYFYSYKRFLNYVWPPNKLRLHLNKTVAKNSPIEEREGYPTKNAREERVRLGGKNWEMNDVLSGQLLIIDEPQLFWEVKSGEGYHDMFNVVRALIEYSYARAAADPTHEPVTVLLLTATPEGAQDKVESSQLERAAKLVNLLIRDEKLRLPISGDLNTVLRSKKGEMAVLDAMRGYISYFDGANNITRFARVEKNSVIANQYAQDEEDGGGEDEDIELGDFKDLDLGMNEGEEEDDEALLGDANAKKIPPKREALDNADYDGALQLICAAKNNYEIPSNDAERKEAAQCYMNNSVFPNSGRRYLPSVFRDFNLTDAQKMNDFIIAVELKAPKLKALYANATTRKGKGKKVRQKHFIISNADTNTSVGSVASLFRSQGHPKVILSLSDNGEDLIFKEMLPNGTIRNITSAVDDKEKGRYIVLTRSSVLFQGGEKERDILKTHRNTVFDFINNRKYNTRGAMVQYIIADKSYREGVSFFDVVHAHLMERMSTTEETQAIGRVRRMCGQCALPYKKGWQLQVSVYEVNADRLPWFAKQAKKAGSKDWKWQQENGMGNRYEKAANFRIECERRGCGTYGYRIVELLESKTLQRFSDLLKEAAIDKGFYEIPDDEELKEIARKKQENEETAKTKKRIENVQLQKIKKQREMQIQEKKREEDEIKAKFTQLASTPFVNRGQVVTLRDNLFRKVEKYSLHADRDLGAYLIQFQYLFYNTITVDAKTFATVSTEHSTRRILDGDGRVKFNLLRELRNNNVLKKKLSGRGPLSIVNFKFAIGEPIIFCAINVTYKKDKRLKITPNTPLGAFLIQNNAQSENDIHFFMFCEVGAKTLELKRITNLYRGSDILGVCESLDDKSSYKMMYAVNGDLKIEGISRETLENLLFPANTDKDIYFSTWKSQ